MGKNTQPFNTAIRSAIQKELGTLCQLDDVVIEAGKQRDDATGRLANILIEAKVEAHWLKSPYSHKASGKLHDGVTGDHIAVFNYLIGECDKIQFAGDAGKQRQALMATHDANPGRWKELMTPAEIEIVETARTYANSKVSKIHKRMMVEIEKQAALARGESTNIKKGNLQKASEAIERIMDLLSHEKKLLASYWEDDQRRLNLVTLEELRQDLAPFVNKERDLAAESARKAELNKTK